MPPTSLCGTSAATQSLPAANAAAGGAPALAARHRRFTTDSRASRTATPSISSSSSWIRPSTDALASESEATAGAATAPRRPLEANPFLSSAHRRTGENQNRLRAHAGLNRPANRQRCCSIQTIKELDWSQERQFWTRQILPLVEINYWRSLDDSGQPSDLCWRIDTPFQLLFVLDILLRALRLKRRYLAIRRDALLRRWIDPPRRFPFWRVLRIVPVTERCSASGPSSWNPRAVIRRCCGASRPGAV